MRDKRKAKNCLISRQQAGYKYRFHVPLILNGIGGILFAPLAQMDKSTRLLIGWPWVRAPHGAYAEVAEWHTHAVQSRNFAGSTPAFCTTALTDGKKKIKCRSGGIGIRTGLRILRYSTMWVRIPPSALTA